MNWALYITIGVAILIIGAFVALYFFGKKMQKRQEENQQQMDAIAQSTSILVIDKKKMRIKDAGLPPVIYEKTPFYLRRSKVPVVKAKIGPKVMTLMCDAKVYENIPVKKEVKAVISGIYITGIKGLRGPLEAPVKKKKWYRFGR